ncbi:MAG: hypothetical protein U0136_09035 [Bdellovibrionota bacterium]
MIKNRLSCLLLEPELVIYWSMEPISFLVAFLLAVGGLALTLYFVWVLFDPIIRTFGGQQQLTRTKRMTDRIARVDSLIDEKQFKEALKLLRSAPIYDVFERPELLALIRDHHQNILSRCVVLAEELDTHPANLADVERLALERTELLSLFIRARESFKSLKSRRQKNGKDVPMWSRADFDQRLTDIQTELANNRIALKAAFDKLFDSIESSPKPNDIVYH